ncbi:MAG: hypothetical protein WAU35_11250, partial [Azonexus sp.]
CDSPRETHGQWRPGMGSVNSTGPWGQGRPPVLPGSCGMGVAPILFFDSSNQGASNGRQHTGAKIQAVIFSS